MVLRRLYLETGLSIVYPGARSDIREIWQIPNDSRDSTDIRGVVLTVCHGPSIVCFTSATFNPLESSRDPC